MTFKTIGGEEYPVSGREGYSIMELGVSNGIPGISGDCGGVLACATCHVHVPDSWWSKVGEPSDLELDMLEAADNVTKNSRLCCQIQWSAALDGLTVVVPEA